MLAKSRNDQDIDESSLQRTLGVLNTIFRDSLRLNEDVKKYGIIIYAGDQPSLSFLDKVIFFCLECKSFTDSLSWYDLGVCPLSS